MKIIREFCGVLTILLMGGYLHADIPGDTNKPRGNPDVDSEETTLFMAPIQAGGNNLFHSLILIPTLENAETIKTSYAYVRGGAEYTMGNFSDNRGAWKVDYNAALVESYLSFRYGFAERLELRARLTGAALAEENAVTLFKSATQYLSGNGGIGVSNMVIGVKIPHRGQNALSAQSLGLSLKIPLSPKDNMIDSDSTDIAISYFYSYKIKPDLYLHSYLGYTLAGKIDVFDHLFNPSDVIYYGAGLSWRAADSLVWINQIQGNNNAFREIDALTKAPLTLQTGLRYSEDGKFFNEISFGAGLNKGSADFTLSLSMGTMF